MRRLFGEWDKVGAEGGIVVEGVAQVLDDWAIPLSLLCGLLSPITLSLFLPVGLRLVLPLSLTRY